MSNNDDYKWSIEKSKNNFDILLINEKFIHSNFNPLNEAADFICPDKSLILIFGLGLAYHVNNIIKNNPGSSIIIFEPLTDIFNRGKNYIDKKYLSDKRILLINSLADDLIYHFITLNNSLTPNRIKTYSNLGYKNLFKSQEELFFNIVKNNVETFVRNTLTESAFIPLWSKNILLNINKLSKNNLINPKASGLKENLAVIVCAGPNLVKDINSLKKNRNKITIFAVDTAFKTLFKYNVIPDFIVSLDGQYYSYDDFVFKKFPEITFIFDMVSFPKISKNYDNVYFTLTENIFDTSILEYFFNKFELKKFGIYTGGNVSDYAMNLAFSFGFKNIYFTGLDLSFPDLLTHSLYSPFYDRVFYKTNYFNSFESQTLSIISNRNLKEALSRNENNILTDFVLSNYAHYFSIYAGLNKDCTFYYQNTNALKINNFKKATLDELIKCLKTAKIKSGDLILHSEQFKFSKDAVELFLNNLNSNIYQYAVKLSELLKTTDFNNSEKLSEWKRLIDELYIDFPFFKKFSIMTDIILDKKNIYEDNILFYKHTGHKILQSIYFMIRVIQKISNIN